MSYDLQRALDLMRQGEDHLLYAYYAGKNTKKSIQHLDHSRNFLMSARRYLSQVMNKDALFRKALQRLQKLCNRWNALA